MGDRANIAIKQDGDSTERVWLYTHWKGYALPGILQTALARRQRWDDTTYLTRIIFAQMTKGDEDGESGFGISTQMGDNGRPIIVVDPEKGLITFEPEPDEPANEDIYSKKFTFEEFVSMGPLTTQAELIGW